MARRHNPPPISVEHDDDVAAELEEILRRAEELLSDARARDVSRLLDRWRNRTFVALILGEFKRGKSTLLNALIGQDLLPTGVAPVTSVPTRVGAGHGTRALARFQDGTEREIGLDELRDYVDESRNPGNERRVAEVDVEVETGPPSGIVLVDLPGLGSIHRHNTESALAALPEADAALVVASVDPPIGEAEVRLLRSVRDHAARVEIVLNKVDYLDDAGRKSAEEFVRRALRQEGFANVDVWPVSARDGLRARLSHDDLGWRRSGMGVLSAHLDTFFREERAAVLARSVANKAGRLAGQEAALLEMRLAAEERSSRQLHDIIDSFRSRRVTADRDSTEGLMIFRRRFEGLFADYSERAAEAWKGPRAAFEARIEEILAAHARGSRRAAWNALEPAALRAADAFMETFVSEAAQRLAGAYGELCSEIDRAAAERTQAVWRLAADLLPFEPPAAESPLPAPTPRPAAPQLGSLRLLLDNLEDAAAWLLPRGAALRRLAAQARDDAEARYGRAVEQSRDALRRAYEAHFGGLLAAFDREAQQTSDAVEAALAVAEERVRAIEAGRSDSEAVDTTRRSQLEALRATLRRIEEGH